MTRRSPSLAPDFNFDTYLVVDELETCSVYREADEVEVNRGDVIRQITEGQFNRAVRVTAFNTAEGWAHDATEDIANERPVLERRRFVTADQPEKIVTASSYFRLC